MNKFRRNHPQWLKEFGRNRPPDQIQRVIMKLCSNMDEFREKFARVFKKSPARLSLFDFDFSKSKRPATEAALLAQWSWQQVVYRYCGQFSAGLVRNGDTLKRPVAAGLDGVGHQFAACCQGHLAGGA
jgi:hypothetical protein